MANRIRFTVERIIDAAIISGLVTAGILCLGVKVVVWAFSESDSDCLYEKTPG